MTCRPHFAQIMVEKGYASNFRAAFDDYLDESAKGYAPSPRAGLCRWGAARFWRAGGIAPWRIPCA